MLHVGGLLADVVQPPGAVDDRSQDISFADDDRRICKGHGAENFARLSRIALNLFNAQTQHKVGIKTKRLCCGWNHDYLFRVLTQQNQGLQMRLPCAVGLDRSPRGRYTVYWRP